MQLLTQGRSQVFLFLNLIFLNYFKGVYSILYIFSILNKVQVKPQVVENLKKFLRSLNYWNQNLLPAEDIFKYYLSHYLINNVDNQIQILLLNLLNAQFNSVANLICFVNHLIMKHSLFTLQSCLSHFKYSYLFYHTQSL